MKKSRNRPHYKKMCEALYQSTQHAFRFLEIEDIEGAKIALQMGQSTCEILYYESAFPDYDPKNYDFDKLVSEDSDTF